MALITTPGQLRKQGEFYHQLATLTRAGVSIVQALDSIRKSPPSRHLRVVADRLVAMIVRGSTFTEAVRNSGAKLPEFDIALIEAGEASGRLDQCLQLLGDFYEERGKLIGQVISALMYPVFLFHFAVFIFPTSLFTALILQSGSFEPFVANKVRILVPTYAIVFAILWSMQSSRGRAWRNLMESFLNFVPMVRSTQRDLALARLCAALEALVNAGVTIIEAWDIAARGSGSQRIERAVAAARPRLLQGELPSDAISQQAIYPDLFTSSYRTGEYSGQLDTELRRLYRYYLEAATNGLQRMAAWLPKIIFLGVAIVIGYQAVSFYSGYFNTLNELMK